MPRPRDQRRSPGQGAEHGISPPWRPDRAPYRTARSRTTNSSPGGPASTYRRTSSLWGHSSSAGPSRAGPAAGQQLANRSQTQAPGMVAGQRQPVTDAGPSAGAVVALRPDQPQEEAVVTRVVQSEKRDSETEAADGDLGQRARRPARCRDVQQAKTASVRTAVRVAVRNTIERDMPPSTMRREALARPQRLTETRRRQQEVNQAQAAVHHNRARWIVAHDGLVATRDDGRLGQHLVEKRQRDVGRQEMPGESGSSGGGRKRARLGPVSSTSTGSTIRASSGSNRPAISASTSTAASSARQHCRSARAAQPRADQEGQQQKECDYAGEGEDPLLLQPECGSHRRGQRGEAAGEDQQETDEQRGHRSTAFDRYIN